MDVHRSIELCLAIRSAEFGPAIETNRQLGLRNFAGLGEAHGVHARHQPWASHSRKGNLRGWRYTRWFHTHRPGHAIQAGAFACWKFSDNTSRGIQNLYLQFSNLMYIGLIRIYYGGYRRST